MATVERRKEPREAKRLMLTFTAVGEKRVVRGIATNVSRSGMFIASGTLFPRGTRLMVTAVNDPDQKAVEFEVRNVQRFGDSPGMGLRLVEGGVVKDVTGAFSIGVSGATATGTPAPASASAPTPTPTPAPRTPPAVMPGESVALPESTHGGVKIIADDDFDSPPPLPETPTVFSLVFDTPQKYAEVRKRDLQRGGCFIQASMLPPQDSIVTIEILPPLPNARRVLAEAKVVFRSEPAPGRPGGFGVEFVDRERVLASLPEIPG